ncbi:conserved hypothetical protein [Exiguobacterium sp. 8H]|uniref:hypothetical protein n=1 Tax=unclassified Exiguobacterium TaxID=2644629 RepID=UPI0012F07356|nr:MULTISPECIES: hypothetical protein [unclassified Exiguobacterium]VXB46605.1 conserved hypothetical protein [Exiguobacterium sp. 8A]VXB48336.1 conserved hypothetical protein [Exiguobacterium sp. 8H]
MVEVTNMQIQAQATAVSSVLPGIQTNRTYKAELVKQTGPDSAIVKINGEEVEVTFKDGLPKTNPFQVTLAEQDGILMATVVPPKEETLESAPPASASSKLDAKIQTLLASLPPEVRSAVSRLLQSGRLPMNEDTVRLLETAFKGDMRDVILHLKTLDTPTVPREMAREIAVLSLNEAKQQITPPAPNAPYPQKERYVELVNLSRPVSERVTPTPETIDRVIRDLTPTTPTSPRPIESESRQAMPLPPINGKQVMVKEVTSHLATVTNTFRNEQATVTKQLGQVAALIETNPHAARPALETVSTRLTQLVQKTDALLHTDVTQEKQLVAMTAKLDVALSLLATKPQESATLVKEVRAALNDFRYAPNQTRIEYIPNGATRAGEMPTVAPLKLDSTLSGRHIQEVAQRVQTQAQLAQATSNTPTSALSVRGDTTNPEAQRLASFFQVQQTLNRLDGGQLHQLLFALPAKVQEIDTGIHVHIQNREAGDVVDWENSVLYIRLETPRLGEIGVKLEAKDRNLRLTLEHDDSTVERLARPLLGKIEQTLETIGYKSVTTQFKPLTKADRVIEEPTIAPTTGYDFRI